MNQAPAPVAAPRWTWMVPLLAMLVLAVGFMLPASHLMSAFCLPMLIGAVLVAVHHAEVVAHRIGEPFGTLVLAIAITIIEVALILSAMLAGGPGNDSLPRDTIYATVMIICNGVVGICLLVGGLRHHEQVFRVEGAHAAYAAIITLAAISLVLPSFTTSTIGPTYSAGQLTFAAIASLALWSVFVFGQTIRHRDYFLPVELGDDAAGHEPAASPPSLNQAWASSGLLLVSLVAVVGLAKLVSPSIAAAVAAIGAPQPVIGIAIALLVLLPETWAAIRAALANRLQTSLNLALGSALASIGLTIPAVALAALVLHLPLSLGIDAKSLAMLAVTFMAGAITLASGRTNLMLGAVHLVLFAGYLFLSLFP